MTADPLREALEQIATMYCEIRSRNVEDRRCPDEYADPDNWCWSCVARAALASTEEEMPKDGDNP